MNFALFNKNEILKCEKINDDTNALSQFHFAINNVAEGKSKDQAVATTCTASMNFAKHILISESTAVPNLLFPALSSRRQERIIC